MHRRAGLISRAVAALRGTLRHQQHQEVPLRPATVYGYRRGAYAPGYVDQEATQIIQDKPLMTLGAEYRANGGRHFR